MSKVQVCDHTYDTGATKNIRFFLNKNMIFGEPETCLETVAGPRWSGEAQGQAEGSGWAEPTIGSGKRGGVLGPDQQALGFGG